MSAATITKERPIIFSGLMVRAILDGRKTQTRRVVSRANSATMPPWNRLEFDDAKVPHGAPPTFADNGYLHVATMPHPRDTKQGADWWTGNRVYPIWQPGERLWVRETWNCWGCAYDFAARTHKATIAYRAAEHERCTEINISELTADALKTIIRCKSERSWRPSIYMPRWASRITLEITGVRVERLQDMSEADAMAEGITQGDSVWSGSTRNAFRELWGSINANRGHAWEANPWVWVIEFRRIDQ